MDAGTLRAVPRPTTAAVAAIVIFGIGRLFFLLYTDAFIAFPETQAELKFYAVDLKCKANQLESQIVVQGTSRLLLAGEIPLFKQRWHTKDRVTNISQPLNTFWHMNVLHRRNPGLLDHTELWIIDVLPVQFRVSISFSERDALFLRESSLREKLRVEGLLNRFRAVTDWFVPLWSHHHEVVNWVRALRALRASPREKLEALLTIDETKLPDIAGGRRQLPTDLETIRGLFMVHLYPPGRPLSRVQLDAFDELLGRRPPSTHLLLIHPPFRQDVAGIFATSPGMTAAKDETRHFVESVASDYVHVEWYEAPDALRFTEQDFAIDGIHRSFEGIEKLNRHFARSYRQWFPLKPADQLPPSDPRSP